MSREVSAARDLARAREEAADQVEAAIVSVGIAYREYERLTTVLSERTGADLARRLEGPIMLHLAQAGLSAFLERKLVGTPGSLRALVAEQHDREGIPSA